MAELVAALPALVEGAKAVHNITRPVRRFVKDKMKNSGNKALERIANIIPNQETHLSSRNTKKKKKGSSQKAPMAQTIQKGGKQMRALPNKIAVTMGAELFQGKKIPNASAFAKFPWLKATLRNSNGHFEVFDFSQYVASITFDNTTAENADWKNGTSIFDQPLTPHLIPSLVPYTNLWQRFLFTSIELQWVPQVGTTEPGAFSWGTFDDPTIQLPASGIPARTQLAATAGSAAFQVCEGATMKTTNLSVGSAPFYIDEQSSDVLYKQGKIVIQSNFPRDNTAPTLTYGELWIKGTCIFLDTRLADVETPSYVPNFNVNGVSGPTVPRPILMSFVNPPTNLIGTVVGFQALNDISNVEYDQDNAPFIRKNTLFYTKLAAAGGGSNPIFRTTENLAQNSNFLEPNVVWTITPPAITTTANKVQIIRLDQDSAICKTIHGYTEVKFADIPDYVHDDTPIDYRMELQALRDSLAALRIDISDIPRKDVRVDAYNSRK